MFQDAPSLFLVAIFNTEILDLGSMMDSQDNPGGLSQIYKSKTTLLLWPELYAAGNADLKLDLII